MQPRLMAEKQKESEARLRLFSAAASEGIIIHENGRIMDVNPRGLEIFGYQLEEMIGMDVAETWAPDCREQVKEHIRSKTGRPYEAAGLRKDGSIIPCEVAARNLPYEGRNIRIALIRDLTDRKHREADLLKLEEQYQQAQKMETIGTLAGGIAHDFNNILYAAIGFTELAYNDVPKDGRAAKCLENIMVAHKRASDLINQILTFSRQSKQERKPISVQPALKEAVKLLRKTIPATIEIKQKIDPDCGPILADTTRIHQIVMNLCANAYHAMEDKGGIMTVRLDSVKVASGRSQSGVELEPGNYVRLEVSDTGVGMDEAVLKRIFEPFYTTKGVGKGTGLGLSTVHGIVKEYGGVIQVRSRPGHGTSFFVFFPCCLEDERIDPKTSDEPDLKGTEKILFVDDDEMIVGFVERSLRNKGYEIHSRTNGMEALDAFRADPSCYDVVVTDLNMPRMTGAEMAKKMLEIRPGMPIIICTGFSENVSRQAMLDIGISDLLYKPVISKNLLAAIRNAVSRNKEREMPHEANTGD